MLTRFTQYHDSKLRHANNQFVQQDSSQAAQCTLVRARVCSLWAMCESVSVAHAHRNNTTNNTRLQLPLNSSRHSDPSPLHASHETSRPRTHAALLTSPPLSLADPRDGGFAISPPPSCVLPRSRKRTEKKIQNRRWNRTFLTSALAFFERQQFLVCEDTRMWVLGVAAVLGGAAVAAASASSVIAWSSEPR